MQIRNMRSAKVKANEVKKHVPISFDASSPSIYLSVTGEEFENCGINLHIFLRAAPKLRILVTTRRRLRRRGTWGYNTVI